MSLDKILNTSYCREIKIWMIINKEIFTFNELQNKLLDLSYFKLNNKLFIITKNNLYELNEFLKEYHHTKEYTNLTIIKMKTIYGIIEYDEDIIDIFKSSNIQIESNFHCENGNLMFRSVNLNQEKRGFCLIDEK